MSFSIMPLIQKIKGFIFLRILTTSLILILFHSYAQSSEPIPPTDFEIVAIAGGVSPWSSASKIEIDAQGHSVYYTKNEDGHSQGGFKKTAEFTIDRIALKAVYGAVAKSDFFNLKEHYEEPATLDGSFAEITVTLHGKRHTVRTQNIEMPVFDDINIAINLSTPKEDKILYNAII